MNTSGTSVDLTPTVLNEIINDAVFEGWDVIVGKWLDYFTTSGAFPVVAGTTAYAVPTDFYKFRMLEHGDQRKLKPVSLDERGRYYGQSGEPARYMIINRSIHVFPTPSSAETLALWYVPIKTEMTVDADSLTLDVPIEFKYIMAIGWRDILDRQNLDPSPAIAKMQQYEAKLRTAADSLDATEPFYLGSVRDDNDDLLELR
jgi:hypothetical protein